MDINEEIRDSVSWCRIYMRSKSCFQGHTHRREKARLGALWAIRNDLRKQDSKRRIKRRIRGAIRTLRNLRKHIAYSNECFAEHLEAQLQVYLSFRHI